MSAPTDPAAAAGAAVYSKPALWIYDFFVLGFSNTFVWRCPSHVILDLYNEHVTANHLDVGVGTGFFLDQCHFPSPDPRITLVDLNENSLAMTSHRLARYHPTTHPANILEPLQISGPGFDSVGLSYLLHCLPGTMKSKSVVFDHLKPLVHEDATVFGTTILGAGVSHNPLAKTLMKIYNARGIFSNTLDSRSDLEDILRANFREPSIRVEGCVALFWGKS
jgi:hypothetical protein